MRKATGNHLTHYHPKKHGRKILKETYGAGRRGPQAESTLPNNSAWDEHSAVPIQAILSFSGRADEAVDLKLSGRSNADYALKGTALGWKGKRKVYGEDK